MNLPKVVSDLVAAQNSYDSAAYADCFTETAVMHDEGKAHTGRTAIKEWIANSNEKYKTVMKPVAWQESNSTSVLSAEISGTFEGSPVILNFHFDMADGLIQTLKITG